VLALLRTVASPAGMVIAFRSKVPAAAV